jgi:formylglycine-generating enzyme required for sulfatase activity
MSRNRQQTEERSMKARIIASLAMVGVFCAAFVITATYGLFGSKAAAASQTFADCAGCPEMVVVPAGEFMMGSPPTELYRGAESQHRVKIAKPFALGKFEITFEQWQACVADGGCSRFTPDDHGWGKGKRPVIGVSWDDAKAYVAWLSRKTGKHYRLPSEAEWEYAARGGTTTPFAFGAAISGTQANYDGRTTFGNGATGVFRDKTTPVGSFKPNAFGLYDMHGNVWEWTEDCWSEEYTATTPTDGSPLLKGSCGGRVMRGGSWEDYAGDIRSAARVGSGTDEQTWADGFRIALDME